MRFGCYEEISLEPFKIPLIFKVEYEEASLLIPVLKDASSIWIGDLIVVEDEGDVTMDIGVPGAAWDL